MRMLGFKAQLLLLEIKKKDMVSFKTQETFTNQRSFNRCIRKLLKAKLIHDMFLGRDNYRLTTIGGMFAESIQEYVEG
jgi:predicted transcriptional regulator